jgi:hypothetical protein
MLGGDHQNARELLQAAADRSLRPEEKQALDVHLSTCQSCSAYAEQLVELEVGLYRVMHAMWDSHLPSFNLNQTRRPSRPKLIWNTIFDRAYSVGGFAIIITLLLGYLLFTSFFGGERVFIPYNPTPTFSPTPTQVPIAFTDAHTPSIPSQVSQTATNQKCASILYMVRETDNLESIANDHNTTIEQLLAYNNLKKEEIRPGIELLIPLCQNKPIWTHGIPTNFLTTTPINGTFLPTQPE